MRGREPGFRNRPTVPARSSKNEQASTKKLGGKKTCQTPSPTNSLIQLLLPTRAPVQIQEDIFLVNSPGEHQISLGHQQTVSPSSCQSSSQLSHGELEGETESHYCQ